MINNNVQADVEQLKKEIWYIKKTLASGGQSGGSADLSALEGRVDELEDAVNEIEGKLNIGEKIDVLYDMRSTDPNINRSWTSGMVCGKVIRTDYNKYTSLRIYAYINGCEVQKVIKIANRYKSDFSIYAINSSFDQICYLRFTFPVANAAFQVGQYAIYTFDLVTNTFSTLKGSINNNVYVYRIEAIK